MSNMVSIFLLAEIAQPQAIEKIIENISHQTYTGDIEIIIGLEQNYNESSLDEIISKYTHRFTFKLIKANGLDILKKSYEIADGEFIFYKTIGTNEFLSLWYPRHIEAVLTSVSPKEFYGYSMVEFRNVEAMNSITQAMWWRIENFIKKQPKPEMLLLDEFWHRKDTSNIQYEKLIHDNRLIVSRFNSIFKEKKMRIPKEITVIVYTYPQILQSLLNNSPIQQPQSQPQQEVDQNVETDKVLL